MLDGQHLMTSWRSTWLQVWQLGHDAVVNTRWTADTEVPGGVAGRPAVSPMEVVVSSMPERGPLNSADSGQHLNSIALRSRMSIWCESEA